MPRPRLWHRMSVAELLLEGRRSYLRGEPEPGSPGTHPWDRGYLEERDYFQTVRSSLRVAESGKILGEIRRARVARIAQAIRDPELWDGGTIVLSVCGRRVSVESVGKTIVGPTPEEERLMRMGWMTWYDLYDVPERRVIRNMAA
jgi:hypothetical protein